MEPLDSPPNELLLNFGETNLRTKPRGFKPETSPHGFHDGQMVRGMREATTRPKIKIHYSNSLNREGSSKLGPPIRLYQVSVGTQTSSHDWVDLVSENYSKSDSLSKSWVDLVSKNHQVDLVTKSRQVDLAPKNEVDLVSQNLPSGPPELAINELVMANLEFYRSDVLGTNECVHFSVSREGLSRLPEVYEDPIPQPCAGEGDCPPRTNELFVLEKGENSGEQEKDSTPGALPLVPECNTPPVTSLPPRESSEKPAPEDVPTVTVPDKNPPCPCCETRVNSITSLIEHLKRAHGKKRVCFRCAKCGREGNNFHSIVCHVPKCRPIAKETPAGEWICEVCGRDFKTKIGLGQHKRLTHPVIRNQERIAASHPKEISNRGAHKRCWTKEEEELLIKLVAQFEGNKNINKLIAEHITTKTVKQISDKRRLLPKKPAAGNNSEPKIDHQSRRTAAAVGTDPGRNHRPDKEEEHLEEQWEGQLQAHYRRTLGEWLSAGRIQDFQEAFRQLINDREITATVNQSAQDCFGCLELLSQMRTSTRERRTKGTQEGTQIRPRQRWMTKRAIRKGTFLRFQRLFYLDRGKLARIILDDIECLSCEIPPKDIYSVFKARWETPGVFEGLGNFQINGKADNSAFRDLITAKEIEKNVQEMSKNSAPGPDGFTLRDIKKMDPEYSRTAEIFNLWLTAGKIPDMVRGCRTVLIPKSSQPERLKDLNNWRPITIGSILLRLFSRILTARLTKACPLNPRQRGFIKAAGCSENLKLLQTIIRSAKREHRPLGVVFVDIAKAFDTVSHQHILHVLQQRKVDPHIIELVRDMYKNINTCITTKKTQTDPIQIRVGVKQGDPMSPLLFNLAMDPLLCKLEESNNGYHQGLNSITAMAFADDLVLLSDSWENMKRNIEILETFCNLTGLKTQGQKCHGFYIKPTKDSYTVNDCAAWTIGGTPLNMIDPGDSEKYLGLQIDPWTGVAKSNLDTKLDFWLQQIGKAPLKPLQKIDILKTYTIPRLTYLADHSELKAGFLEALDLKIRSTVKEWLHLPACTCDAILYSSTKDGGLGITKLAGLIPSVQARRLHRLAQSSDETMKVFLEKDQMEQTYKKLWVQAGGDREKIPSIWDTKPVSVSSRLNGATETSEWEAASSKNKFPKPCNWRKTEFNNWTKLVSQGRGIGNFEGDKISNHWLENYRGIPHRKLLTALQLRANVYPTREFLARGRQDKHIKACRHCKADNETCAHIIGNCPATQDARIKRHNYICEVLSREAKKKDWVVFQEPHLRDNNKELYKPDLVLVKDARAFVVDVTVRYESAKTSLEEAAAEKVDKYKHLEKEIQELTNAKDIVFVGFPLGARGKWYHNNFELLEALGLSRTRQEKTARTLTSIALTSSVDIVHMFASRSRNCG